MYIVLCPDLEDGVLTAKNYEEATLIKNQINQSFPTWIFKWDARFIAEISDMYQLELLKEFNK